MYRLPRYVSLTITGAAAVGSMTSGAGGAKAETGTFACAWPICVFGASRQY